MNEVSERVKGEQRMKKNAVIFFFVFLIGMVTFPQLIHAEKRSKNDVVVFFEIEQGSESLLKDSSGNETEVIRKVIPASEDISNYIPKIAIKNDEEFIKWDTDIQSKDEIVYTAVFKDKSKIETIILLFPFILCVLLLILFMVKI